MSQALGQDGSGVSPGGLQSGKQERVTFSFNQGGMQCSSEVKKTEQN